MRHNAANSARLSRLTAAPLRHRPGHTACPQVNVRIRPSPCIHPQVQEPVQSQCFPELVVVLGHASWRDCDRQERPGAEWLDEDWSTEYKGLYFSLFFICSSSLTIEEGTRRILRSAAGRCCMATCFCGQSARSPPTPTLLFFSPGPPVCTVRSTSHTSSKRYL